MATDCAHLAAHEAPEPTLGDSFLDLDADDGWARDMAASLALMPPAEARGTVLKGVCAASGDSGGSGTTRGGDSLTLTNSRGDLGGCGDEDGCAIRPHGKKHILGHSEMTPLASLRYLSPDSVMPGHQAVTGGPFPFFTLRGGLRAPEARHETTLDAGALLLRDAGELFDALSDDSESDDADDGLPCGGPSRSGGLLLPDLSSRGDGAPNQLRLDVGAVLAAWRGAGGAFAGGAVRGPRTGGLHGSPYARPVALKAPVRSSSGRTLRGAAAAAAEAVAAHRGGAPSQPQHPPPQQADAPPPQPRVPMLLRLEDAPGYTPGVSLLGLGSVAFGSSPGLPGLLSLEDDGVTRGDRVERFLKKRRERQFVTKVRYEVRKLNAEARPRFKGRFVKTGDEAC